IIGLDRGEKHLVYYSVINQKGDILDQGSLNVINGQDYYQKLVEREKERRENRQSWSPVAKIKDLKAGYVSQVVRKIVDLAIQYNAIIVMEDLNMRFKQVRGGIERSVYQQLEKQLIDKLNYLVFKDREPTEPGGILNGYQLAAPFETFEKMGKQTGIIFYTQAEYTSTTDPLTGFRKNIYISNSPPQEKIKDTLEKFDAIGWDEEEQSYFFTYNPINFADKKMKNNAPSKTYTVYSKVPRIRREKDENGYWQHSVIDLNEKFRELFDLWDFERPDAEDLRDEILRKETDGELAGKRMFDGKERSFYQAFIYLFNLVLNLRNSFSEQWKTETDEHGNIKAEKLNTSDVDFIASPVKPFFSTYAEYKGRVLSPQNFAEFDEKIKAEDADRIRREFNGDANGAYNIARKGIIILENISKKPDRPDLFVSKKDWDKHTQEEWNPTSPSVP
ncbi:type V CRISPR-associated protein Cas12a/Cpf1, partial [Candidatus Saccharibacteria bacterium]|nr:type V CRISPR-associated protein Cas12a/Cpf1 [Candidatus Saccharibacteria bacterium]